MQAVSTNYALPIWMISPSSEVQLISASSDAVRALKYEVGFVKPILPFGSTRATKT